MRLFAYEYVIDHECISSIKNRNLRNSMTANIKREIKVDPVTTPASKSLVSSQASSIVVLGSTNMK